MVAISREREHSRLQPTLLLFFAFSFAFLTNEAIHEFGHYLANGAYGVTNQAVVLDPFGASHITLGEPLPQGSQLLAAAAGPLLNLVTGLILLVLFWHRRAPTLLPLLLMGPVAMVQESVTFSLGLLTPGGDADLMVASGVPAGVLIGLGVALLIGGLLLIARMLGLAGLQPKETFASRLGVIAGGMAALMVVRFVASLWRAPEALVENGVPLVFSLLLAVLVAGIFPAVSKRSDDRALHSRSGLPGIAIAMSLAAGMFLFQLAFFN